MNVVFDIMALGTAQAGSTGRTGIFRVVENLALGLIDNAECHPMFVATAFANEASEFLAANPPFFTHPLKYPTGYDRIVNGIGNRVNKNALARKILGFSPLSLPANNLTNLSRLADIYHSPYMPIPAEVQKEKIQKFLTVHDLIAITHPQYFENNNDPLVKYAIKSIADDGWVFCVSESTKTDLCNYIPIDPNRIFVTPLAASKEIFYHCTEQEIIDAVRVKYKLGHDEYLLSLSTLEPRKNIAHTIRCFAQLIEDGAIKNTNLVLAGSTGWDFEHIFSELSNPAIRNRIIVTGFVDDYDLAPLYSGAIGFVYPSFYEGFGLPPLEAMQCGTPVIVSNVSSLPEVVGSAGLLVAPTDEPAMCQAMTKICNDTSFRKDLSIKSQVQAALFSWDNCLDATIAGYRKALN